MNRIQIILLSLGLLIGLSACGNNQTPPPSTGTTSGSNLYTLAQLQQAAPLILADLKAEVSLLESSNLLNASQTANINQAVSDFAGLTTQIQTLTSVNYVTVLNAVVNVLSVIDANLPSGTLSSSTQAEIQLTLQGVKLLLTFIPQPSNAAAPSGS